MYVVSRATGTKIKILNATDNTDVSEIDRDAAILTGRTFFFFNDVEVNTNGSLLAANLTTNTSTSPFKIYKWDNETATPTVYINYSNEGMRLGDFFTVTGDI